MNNREKIIDYVKSHNKPVQEAIPEFYQKWATQYGPEYWRSSTCERSLWTPDGAIVKAPGKSDVETAYVHYIPEYDMLEFSKVVINNKGRHQDYEIHEWEYSSYRIFLIKGVANPYDSYGEELWTEAKENYYNMEFYRYLKKLQHCFFCNAKNPQYKEFERFCGYKTDPGDFAEECYRYMIPRNHENEFPEPKKDKREIVQEYLSYRKQTASCRESSSLCLVYFERIDDDNAVIRTFVISDVSGGIDKMGIWEHYRIYITPNVVRVMEGHLGTWTNARALRDYEDSPVFNESEFKQFKRVAYIYDTALGINEGREDIDTIYRLLRYPAIEMLYKSGYKHIAKYLVNHRNSSIAFRNMFGKEIQSKGNIYRKTGCNKHMLSIIDGRDTCDYSAFGNALRIFREAFGKVFMYFTKDKIEKYFNAFVELGRCAQLKQRKWDKIIPIGGTYNRDDIKTVEGLVKIYNKEDHGIFSSLADTSVMYEQLGLDFNNAVAGILYSARDIFNLHDQMVIRYNASRYKLKEIRELSLQKSFEKLQEGRIKLYNYENDEYIIRVPESINEIIAEGSKLHHCVGCYAYRHAEGNTNIVFLRQKSKPNEPYYTIEVQHKRIVQIHGFANRWLGCSPKAVSFVYEWIQSKGFECQKDILLSQAQGYAKIADLLDESYLFSNEHTMKATKAA